MILLWSYEEVQNGGTYISNLTSSSKTTVFNECVSNNYNAMLNLFNLLSISVMFGV